MRKINLASTLSLMTPCWLLKSTEFVPDSKKIKLEYVDLIAEFNLYSCLCGLTFSVFRTG